MVRHGQYRRDPRVKIALVGSAPSSIALAPYDDPSWAIWACSPGAYGHLKRCDAFFEIHRWTPGERGFSPDYDAWMAKCECPVYLIEPRPDIPNSIAYPAEAILAQYPGFARSFFTSSLAWMLALAIANIEEKRKHPKPAPPPPVPAAPASKRDAKGRFLKASDITIVSTGHTWVEEQDEIGLWGVDMAAADEYGHQKPGCHFFMLEAQKRGIKVTVPPESDLGRPIPLYGIGEASPMRVKMDVRMLELQQRQAEILGQMAEADKAYRDAREHHAFISGAVDNQQWFLNTWTE